MKRVILSRTDSIGDVILSLPVAGILRKSFPDTEIFFLGRKYTADIIKSCSNIDEFLNWDIVGKEDPALQAQFLLDQKADVIIHLFPEKRVAEAAKNAGIEKRIGTTNRIYHWNTCNVLVPFSRRRSELHESQLNLKLLHPFGIKEVIPVSELYRYYGFDHYQPETLSMKHLVDTDAIKLILHPGSKGSARNWPLKYFIKLAALLPHEKYRIFLTGTSSEREEFSGLEHEMPENVSNLMGYFRLDELMAFIWSCDGLVAASTGPLHIAAALGKHAFGMYPPIRPMHPGRWAPVGRNTHVFVNDKECNKCRNEMPCVCMEMITPEMVAEQIQEVFGR